MTRLIILSVLFISISFNVFSQKKEKKEIIISPAADSLIYFSQRMFNSYNDILRYEANENFKRILSKNLYNEEAINWSFDTVKILSVQGPKDQYFKIFTWCLPLHSGKYDHYGLILVLSKKTGNYKVIELRDVSGQILTPEKQVLKKGVWYGAVYYQIIENKIQGKKVYTLIGWNGWNSITQQKIIEILTFNQRDEPVFGKIMFRGRGFFGKKRLIFEYGDDIVMKVRFEHHNYKIIKKKDYYRRNARKNKDNARALKADKKRIKEKIKNAPMIVYDELIPIRAELEGQYQFYYPLSAEGNAFYFDNGRWNFRKLDLKDIYENNDKKINYGLKPEE